MLSLWGLALAAAGCPFFTEFFPDPSLVADRDGEFVEVAWDSGGAVLWDTLYVSFENKAPFFWVREEGKSRVLWHRDVSACPETSALACEPLTVAALPNNRSAVWSLRAGACADSAFLPAPKPGETFQRAGAGPEDFVLAAPTPGMANTVYETGARDCRLAVESVTAAEARWELKTRLAGCDSAKVKVRMLSLEDAYLEDEFVKTLRGSETFYSTFSSRGLWFQVKFPEDDYPANDTWDTVFIEPHYTPVYISEVHPCPEEPVPEWVELYNPSERNLPLSRIHFCGRAAVKAAAGDSLQKRETLLLSRDTLALREWLGVSEVRIAYANLGFLKNAADTLRLCFDALPVDSVFWGKSTAIKSNCPNGFNPRTQKKDSSPGFQKQASAAKKENLSFQPFWNARVFSKKRPDFPLMVSAESEKPVKVELLSGKGILLWSADILGGSGKEWAQVPLLEKGTLGANYLRFSEGRHEKMVGIILRP
ncbi:MAG: hypothetical protein LBR60_01835 [Fibrobacter sp.]|jgi:hypothetical protein|nr:hypothetical protein [Fibrobacter sp.]